MADIPANESKHTNVEIVADGPHSETLMNKIGANINSLIDDKDTNATNIATNVTNISTNTSNISTNTGNISTNTTDIATNTAAIAGITHASLVQRATTGPTGALRFGRPGSTNDGLAIFNAADSEIVAFEGSGFLFVGNSGPFISIFELTFP